MRHYSQSTNALIDYYEAQELSSLYNPSKIPKKRVSNKGSLVFRDGKLLFNRVGPINRQYQDNARAPAKRGIWAFPFPFFEPFYVSGYFSHHNTLAPKNGRELIRLSEESVELLKAKKPILEEDLKRLRASVPDWKAAIEEPGGEHLYNKEFSLEYDIKQIDRLIEDRECAPYDFYSIIDDDWESPGPPPPIPGRLSHAAKVRLRSLIKKWRRTSAHLKDKAAECYIDTPHKGITSNKNFQAYETAETLDCMIEGIEMTLDGHPEATRSAVHDALHSDHHSRTRRFFYSGPLYARVKPKGDVQYEKSDSFHAEGWHRYDDIHSYMKALRKSLIEYRSSHESGFGDPKAPRKRVKLGVKGTGSELNLSSDHLEVFIPM
jgi:hypothetical protein